jgi:hypothetical protein
VCDVVSRRCLLGTSYTVDLYSIGLITGRRKPAALLVRRTAVSPQTNSLFTDANL